MGSLTLLQPRQGYHFSIDSVLLAAFAALKNGPIVDLGAGCGIITRLLARRGAAGPFTAVEINPKAAACCEANLAGCQARVLHHDARLPHAQLLAQSYSLVVCNPPFGQPGRGRTSPEPDRALAREQSCFTLNDLWRISSRLLRHKGRLAFCLPPRLLDQAILGMAAHNLFAKRLRLVHGRDNLPAKIALLEAVNGGGFELNVEPPLIVYTDTANTMHPEVAGIYAAI